MFVAVIVIVYFIVLALYIKEDTGGDFKRATRLKMTLSSLFCIVGAIGLVYRFQMIDASAVLIVCGLVSALVGDYFLRFIQLDAKKFNIGISFFALTQAIFLISMFLAFGVGIAEFMIMAALLIAALILMKKQNWQLGKAQMPLTVYMILLSLMMAKAVSVAFIPGEINIMMLHPHPVQYLLMAAGAILFWTSDLLLGIWNYHSRKKSITAWNSITYFTGTMLIALSLYPLFQILRY